MMVVLFSVYDINYHVKNAIQKHKKLNENLANRGKEGTSVLCLLIPSKDVVTGKPQRIVLS